jgi:hypothetical protein
MLAVRNLGTNFAPSEIFSATVADRYRNIWFFAPPDRFDSTSTDRRRVARLEHHILDG